MLPPCRHAIQPRHDGAGAARSIPPTVAAPALGTIHPTLQAWPVSLTREAQHMEGHVTRSHIKCLPAALLEGRQAAR